MNRNIVLILDNLRSVCNVASLFRTADCFGVSKIYLCGTTPAPVDRFGRAREDFKKISLGAELTVPWEHHQATSGVVSMLQQQGYIIGALEQSTRSVSLHTFLPTDSKYAIVLGAEVVGVGDPVVESADVVWEIEQFGAKESLNVCIAGSIALYHLRFGGSVYTL